MFQFKIFDGLFNLHLVFLCLGMVSICGKNISLPTNLPSLGLLTERIFILRNFNEEVLY
jgi:hypothetical protein